MAWVSSVRPPIFFNEPLCLDRICSTSMSYTSVLGDRQCHRPRLYRSDFSRGVSSKSSCAYLAHGLDSFWMRSQFRLYSSNDDGSKTTGETHAPGKDGNKFDNQKILQETTGERADLDLKELMDKLRLATESNKKASPFWTRRDKFKSKFIRRIIPWEKLDVSWDNFPYYINEHAKSTLVECATAHLSNKELSASHGARLTSSSARILLRSVPGSELYQERVVRALAQGLQVPLLVLHSRVLVSNDFNDEHSSKCELDDNPISGADTSESEDESENGAAREEEWASSNKTGDDDDLHEMRAHFLKTIEKLQLLRVEEKVYSSRGSIKHEVTEHSSTTEQEVKIGDHVKYVGQSPNQESAKRNLAAGQRGVVLEVRGDEVAVVFDLAKDNKEDEGGSEEISKEHLQWVHMKEIERDSDAEDDCYIAIEALSEVLDSVGPVIVYFRDFSRWLSKAVPRSKRKDFVHKVAKMFDQLSGPAVLISGQDKVEMASRENLRLKSLRWSLLTKHLSEGMTDVMKAAWKSVDGHLDELFTNVISVNPPKEEELLKKFNKQIEEDRKNLTSRSNLYVLQKVLEENDFSCMELLNVNTNGVIMTKKRADKIVGWAKNYYLSNCSLPTVRGGCLLLPRESLEIAIRRLKEQEIISQKQAHNPKNLAEGEYETNFVSAVLPSGEIGVKFDDVGALEDAKQALNELVILPMRRPELFTRGNLLRPCKGILLFGPPGTGKTLLAKALATEAGANFINITGSTLTSKWFGDAEKLTKALFSFASKLAPVIIFVDEVDSFLGARGRASEHEGSRRMKNEFMAAWDGLLSKDSQRILILGATNRPFDLDDAVVRRFPRRIYVGLPDASNRLKILKILLAQENLEADFEFEALANATDGYSGSDLKNLCIAAAYRSVQELLEEELKGGKGNRPLRSLKLDDFIQSKSKVGPSVADDAASMNELRKWQELYGEGGSRRRSHFGFAIR